MFIDYLKESFDENTPILLEEIQYKARSRSWILQTLEKLCVDEQIAKFDTDVYYIPTKTLLGKSTLSATAVVAKKFIQKGDDIFGFFSGIAMQNYLGLSTQMAATPTIFTNKTTKLQEKVRVGWYDVILKKGKTIITPNNVSVLAILELVDYSPKRWFEDKNEEKMKAFERYIKENKITKAAIEQYLPLFSDSTSQKLIESELMRGFMKEIQ